MGFLEVLKILDCALSGDINAPVSSKLNVNCP